MQSLLKEHKPTSNSPNLETNIKDDLDCNADDCDEAHWFEIDIIQLDTVHLFEKWIKLFDCVSVQHPDSTMPVGCNFSTVAINAIK